MVSKEQKTVMKKLLLLGGSRYIVPVINVAHELGCEVITCDYLPGNIAHKYSDKYINASVIEKEQILQVSEELNIDGIMSFACDPGVVTAAYVAEKMHLPSCGSYESVEILQNKDRFRSFLQKNGFNTPKSKSYNNISDLLDEIESFSLPLIVKPVDSAGSRGVAVVDSIENTKELAENALSFSRSKRIIVEEYIQQQGYSSDSECFTVNGNLEFVSFSSQGFDSKANNPFTPAAFGWPSLMKNEIKTELTSEIQRLVRLLNMGTSIYNVETREGTDGKAYIMECSPRGGGNRLAECLEYATGAKLIENAVRGAIGMPVIIMDNNKIEGFWAEIIIHSKDEGIFEEIFIDESIQKYIVDKDICVNRNEKVYGFNAANESLGEIIFRFEKEDDMRKVLNDVDRYVFVKLNTRQ